MAKDRDALDYLSLGNQLLQTSRLGDVQQAQSALVALEAERAQSERRNADAQMREDEIREFVFSSSKWLKGLEAKYAESKPMATLVLVYGLQQHIKEMGISTGRFRSYEDKEKVHAFLENVGTIIEACENRVGSEALHDVNTCIKYKSEERNLKELLCYKARERMARDSGAMPEPDHEDHFPASAEAVRGKQTLLQWFAILAGAITILPALLLATGVGRIPSRSEVPIVIGSLLVGAVGLITLARYGASKPSKEGPDAPAKSNTNKRLQEELDLIMDHSRVRLLEEQFSAGDFDYCKDLYSTRTALIQRVMGYDDSGQQDDFLRRSCEGQNLLERTPEKNAAILIFGSKAPANGYFFGSNKTDGLTQFVETQVGLKVLALDPETRRKYIRSFINQGYTLCFKTGETVTIFTWVNPRIAPEGIESLKQFFGITPATTIDYNGWIEPARVIFPTANL